jgi:para-nitrobenzyl esterase
MTIIQLFSKTCLILVLIFIILISTRIGGLSMSTLNTVFSKPIKIESGKITGVALGEEKAVYAFKGIPYAAPPVGDLRWRPPRQVSRWEGVKACTDFGYACPQQEMPEPYARDFGEQREDCLYLNVWTGAKKQDERRPVMVWIHGGGFYLGAASTESYDGEVLAREGVVLVTINYRIGPFGFLAHPLLSKESDRNVSGNYGLLDQIAALTWVKNNIAAFGGDPDRVTIFGESGGARSVCFLMVTPLSKGLFHGGIVQSGSLYRAIGHLKEPRDGLMAIEKQGEALAKKLGCETLKDLRKKSADEILNTATPKTAPFVTPPNPSPSSDENGIIVGPIIDGWVIPDDPVKLFRSGKQHDVPMIIGSNKDEASMFLGRYRYSQVKQFHDLVRHLFPNHYEKIQKLYPMNDDADVLDALNRFMTDVTWTRPARATARQMGLVKSSVYLYHLTQHRPGMLERFGAFHGADIRYVFGHDMGAGVPFSEEEWALSDKMLKYWINFAAHGDPNGPDLPKWPAYEKDTDQCIDLGRKIKVITNLRKEACDLFDRIDEERRRN